MTLFVKEVTLTLTLTLTRTRTRTRTLTLTLPQAAAQLAKAAPPGTPPAAACAVEALALLSDVAGRSGDFRGSTSIEV